MAVLKCSTCTAPLDVEGSEAFVTCKFCKSRNRVMRTVQGPQLVKVSPLAGRMILLLVLGLFVLPIVGVVVAIVAIGAGTAAVLTTAQTSPPPAIPSIPMPPPQMFGGGVPAAPAPTRISPSQLAALSDRTSVEVEAPGMVGTFASFDPGANLAWATSIARAWTTDARVKGIYLDAVRPDGTIDLSARADWFADYRFYSPTRRQAQRAVREVSEEEVVSELRVMISASRIQVQLAAQTRTQLDRPDEPPLETRCTVAQVMQLLRDRGLPPRPNYDIALLHVGWWRWSVNDATLSRSAVQIDGTTCSVR
jgi:hypothetical protein